MALSPLSTSSEEMAPQQRTADDDATDRGLSLLDVLPPGALVEVMRVIGFPSRHIAASVCREFRDAAGDATFTTRVRHGQSIGDACDEAAPGDTVVVPAGYYLETVVLPDKPLKIVGARADDIFGGSRPGVVVEVLLFFCFFSRLLVLVLSTCTSTDGRTGPSSWFHRALFSLLFLHVRLKLCCFVSPLPDE